MVPHTIGDSDIRYFIYRSSKQEKMIPMLSESQAMWGVDIIHICVSLYCLYVFFSAYPLIHPAAIVNMMLTIKIITGVGVYERKTKRGDINKSGWTLLAYAFFRF